jgi:hypothetical protein
MKAFGVALAVSLAVLFTAGEGRAGTTAPMARSPEPLMKRGPVPNRL